MLRHQRLHGSQQPFRRSGDLDLVGRTAGCPPVSPPALVHGRRQHGKAALPPDVDAYRRPVGRGVPVRPGPKQDLPTAAAGLLSPRFGLDAVVVHGEDAAPPFAGGGTLLVVQVDHKDIPAGLAGQDAHVVAGRMLATGAIPACKYRIWDKTALKLSPFRQLGALPRSPFRYLGRRVAGITCRPQARYIAAHSDGLAKSGSKSAYGVETFIRVPQGLHAIPEQLHKAGFFR